MSHLVRIRRSDFDVRARRENLSIPRLFAFFARVYADWRCGEAPDWLASLVLRWATEQVSVGLRRRTRLGFFILGWQFPRWKIGLSCG